MASRPVEPEAADGPTSAIEERRNQLDGVRALLFLCIFVLHHALDRAEFLVYAVPAFFVLSAFLITRVVQMCQAGTRGARLWTFYARRAIRILPPYILFVGLLLVFDSLQNPAAYAFFFVNVKLFQVSLHQELPAFINWWANWNTQDLHLWSVAVEEQFYLLFPLVYFLVPQRQMKRAFVTALAVGLASRTYFMTYYPTSFYGFLLTSCLEYFAWGAFFAWHDFRGQMPRLAPWQSIYLPALAAFALIGLEYRLDLDGYFHQSTTHLTALIAPLFALTIWGVWAADRRLVIIRFLNWRPLVYLGQISYALYLTHLTFIVVAQRTLRPYIEALASTSAGRTAWTFVISLALAVAASAAMWHGLEVPASKLKKYVPLGPRVSPASKPAPPGAVPTSA